MNSQEKQPSEKRKIRINIEIEVEELQNSLMSILKTIYSVLEGSFYGLIILVFGDKLFEKTIAPKTTQPKHSTKNGVFSQGNTAKHAENGDNYTANNNEKHFENDREEREQIIEKIDLEFSSTLRKCANPECTNIFEKVVRGNQEKKYCSTTCKDKVHNKRKAESY